MRKVIFTPDIAKITLSDLPENTLIIVHDMYDRPMIDRPTVDWLRFRATYAEYEVEQFVIVGANRMINPSNRCDMVNDYLQVMTKSIPKVSIDTSPFIGEPWRAWYHYSLAFGEWLGVDYSYPVEGEWKKWFYYEQNTCKLAPEYLPVFIKATESDLDLLRSAFRFYELDPMHEQYYQEAKRIVFEKHDTPKLLTNNLLKLLNTHFGIKFGLDSYLENKDFLLPEIGVYRYLAEENKRRMDIYNCFTREKLQPR